MCIRDRRDPDSAATSTVQDDGPVAASSSIGRRQRNVFSPAHTAGLCEEKRWTRCVDTVPWGV
eukprot:4445570-Prymnesium_polylepis.1